MIVRITVNFIQLQIVAVSHLAKPIPSCLLKHAQLLPHTNAAEYSFYC